jgi:hypothetical protein
VVTSKPANDTNTGRMTQYHATINSSSVTGGLTWNGNGSLQQLQVTDPFNSANNQTCGYARDDLARLGQARWTAEAENGGKPSALTPSGTL